MRSGDAWTILMTRYFIPVRQSAETGRGKECVQTMECYQTILGSTGSKGCGLMINSIFVSHGQTSGQAFSHKRCMKHFAKAGGGGRFYGDKPADQEP